MKSFVYVFLLGYFVFHALAQPRKQLADFLIIERVDKLLIYNKYQQKIARAEENIFVPFVPIRIINSQAKLNDNYTPCMKVEVLGNVYYLIKDYRSALIGTEKGGYHRVYNDVSLVMDTAQVKANLVHKLDSPSRERHFQLTTTQRFIRFFRMNDWVYVRPISRPSQFGWIPASAFLELPAQDREASSSIKGITLPGKTIQRIETKFDEVNSLFIVLFSRWNRETSQNKIVPRWIVTKTGKTITATLKPETYRDAFPESIQYLIQQLENILTGTNYIITSSPGQLVIRNK
jgi:hypothetical protein